MSAYVARIASACSSSTPERASFPPAFRDQHTENNETSHSVHVVGGFEGDRVAGVIERDTAFLHSPLYSPLTESCTRTMVGTIHCTTHHTRHALGGLSPRQLTLIFPAYENWYFSRGLQRPQRLTTATGAAPPPIISSARRRSSCAQGVFPPHPRHVSRRGQPYSPLPLTWACEVREDGLQPQDRGCEDIGNRDVKLAQLCRRNSDSVCNRKWLHRI